MSINEKKEKDMTIDSDVLGLIKIWESEMDQFITKPAKGLIKNCEFSLKEKFNNSLDEFQNYCKLLKTSKFLTLSGFKLTLDWAIKFYTIERIMADDGWCGVSKGKL